MPPRFPLIIAVVTIAFGLVTLRANPRRFTNQIFFVGSFLISAQMWCIFRAALAGSLLAQGEGHSDPIPWLKANGAVIAFFPWTVWLLKESVTDPKRQKLKLVRRSLPWLAFGLAVAALSMTEWYIPSDSEPTNQKRGPAYLVTILAVAAAYVYLVISTRKQHRIASGIRRIELQFLVMNLGIAALLSVIFHAVGNFLHLISLKEVGLLLVPASYVLTAWALSIHRVFSARQLFLAIGQRITLVVAVSAGVLALWWLFNTSVPEALKIVLCTAFGCGFAVPLDRISRDWFRLDSEQDLADLRATVTANASAEPNPDKLLVAFESLLRERFHASTAEFLFERHEFYAGKKLKLSRARLGYNALCYLSWATPESLQRRRRSSSFEDLQQFVDENTLGVVVTIPKRSPSPATILAVGIKTTDWPFTYPEVQRIQNIAELMDNILTHSRLTTQAALKAKMEHLALMSRGLAHDLKNLITPISTFIMHTDGRFEAASAEGEVYAAARHSVQLMTEYVREALFFASRLTPKFAPADLVKELEAVRQLTASRATHRGVEVLIAPGSPPALTVDAVLLQRLLGNLVNNAIDASDAGGKVIVSSTALDTTHVRLEVADHGCGIAKENLERIFDPYFTTKQFGDDVRGFGLGLTICEKIVNLHQGTIVVRSEAGRGTTVLVDLPAAPSAFAPVTDDALPA